MADWNPRANDLFLKALDVADPDRPAFLAGECGGDADLRKAVDTLLNAHAQAGGFLADPHPDALPTGTFGDRAVTHTFGDGTRTAEPPVGTPGILIAGRYKLLQQIGEGGMGTVWMADQTAPVKRRVAVKLIRAERGSSATILARFAAERQAIALMDHPHIAKLLDAGTTAEGAPFFVMELVKGVPLTEYCDAHRLSVPDRLALFQQICGAVQHAHQKGIIHRDLKPGNILVESHDGKPVPKVIDFGLAKATTGMQLTENTLFTGFGTVMGTPLYMAPEQATFNAVDVDTRADVYALGVILYELLTGTTPLTRDTLRNALLDEMLRLIREQEAPTPSSRLSSAEGTPSAAANRQMEPAKLGRFVRGELDWIVLKALSKDRDRRYETANGFAADVGRFLAHEPVTAGPPSARYRLRKFVQRNRGQVIAAGVVTAAVILGFAGTGVGLVEAKRQEAEARRQEGIAAAETEEKDKALLAALAQKAEADTARLDADAARLDANLELHDNQRIMLRQAWDGGETDKLKAVLDQMRPKPGKPDLRGFETHYLDRAAHAEIDRIAYDLPASNSGGDVKDWWAAGRLLYQSRLAQNQLFSTVTATDLATGKPADGFAPVQLRWPHQQFVPWLTVLPGDPPRLWTAAHMAPTDWNELNAFGGSSMAYQDIRVWDARTGKPLAHCDRLFPDPELVKQGWRHRFLNLCFVGETANRDNSVVITQLIRGEKSADGTNGTIESRVQLHDFKTGKTIRTLDPRPGVIDRAGFSPDNKSIVTVHKGVPALTVWDAGTGAKVWEKSGNSEWAGFTRDGTAVAFSTTNPTDGKSRITEALSLATGQPVFPVPDVADVSYFRQPAAVGAVATTAGNKYQVRDAKTQLLLDTLPSAGGSSGTGGRPRQWTGEGGEVVIPWTAAGNDTVLGAASRYRPSRSEVIPVRALEEGQRLQFTTVGTERVMYTVMTRKDPRLPEAAEVFDLATRKMSRLLPKACEERSAALVLSSDGRTVVVRVSRLDSPTNDRMVYKRSRSLIVCDVASGRERFTTVVTKPADVPAAELHEGYAEFFALSADGTRIFAVDQGGKRILGLDANADTGSPVWEKPLPAEVAWPVHLNLLPNGTRFVLSDAAGVLRVFDTADGKLVTQTAGGPKREKEREDKDLYYDQVRSGVTPDGRTLYFIDGSTLTLIDTAEWTMRHRLGKELPFVPYRNAPPGWRAVGDRFALLSTAEDYQVWDIHSGERMSRFEVKANRDLNQVYYSDATISQCVYSGDGSRAFLLTQVGTLAPELRVIDLPRGREVLALPLGNADTQPNIADRNPGRTGHLSLSADGRELTVTTAHADKGVVLRRVFDARPVTEEELARGKRLDAIRPPTPKPGPRFDPKNPPAAKPPVTASDYFDVALRSQPKEAVVAYRKALELEPDFHPLRHRLADALRGSGDPDGALAEYREAIKLVPRDYVSWYKIAMILENRQDFRGAVVALRKAMGADTRQPTDAGVEVFGGAGPPTRLTLRNALGYNLRESGELAEAENVFREAIKQVDGEKEFGAAMRQWPRPTTLVANLALCLFRQKKAKEAAEVCEAHFKRVTDWSAKTRADAATQNPNQQAWPDDTVARLAAEFGTVFLWADYWAESVEWSDRAIKLWTDYYSEYDRQSKEQPALFPKIPDEQRQIRFAYWHKAVALNWLDKGQEAAAAIDESIKLAPDKDKMYQRMQRARYTAKYEGHEAVTKHVRELLRKLPDPQPTYYFWDAALAYSLCAKAAKGDEKLQAVYATEAVALLEKAVGLGFNDLPLMKKDADLNPLRERDDFKAVLANVGRFERLPRAVALMKAGNTADALAEAAEVEKLAAKPSGVLYNLSCLYSLAAGRIPEKKEHADKAMDLLKQAVKAGFGDAAHMKKDKDLDPLRGRDDFKAVLAALEEKLKPEPELAPPPKAVK